MNISLVYPLLPRPRSLIDENKQYWPPLGLAYIAAVLEKNGHIVKIIDRDILLRKNKMNFEKVDEATDEIIESVDSDMVGIGGTTPTISDVFYLARRLKSRRPNRMVVAGGPHVTAEPELSLKSCEYCDAVVRGEGEFTMLDLANGVPFEKIQGLSFMLNGRVINNPGRPL